MIALIGGAIALLTGIISVVLWYLNNTPERKREKRLAEKRELEDTYAKAAAAGDTATMARVQRRLLELEAEESSPRG